MNANGSYGIEATAEESAVLGAERAFEAPADAPSGGSAGASRRRGATLLQAIHAAVLAELSEGSIGSLTMERVAERARTGKAALYRRWASREELIVDTLIRALPSPPHVQAALRAAGPIRDQLLELVGEMAAVLARPEGALARHILAGLQNSEAMRTALTDRLVQPRMQVLLQVLAGGAERGEVRPEAVTTIVAQVGPSLLLYRFFVIGAVSFADAVAIVDEVLMPLIRPVGTTP